ncbi:MAG: protoheme IX farnesyltransferase [Bacteroidales bacterium]
MTSVLNIGESVRIVLALSKIRISLAVTATTFTGFLVFKGSPQVELIPLLTGIFMMAGGSSAFNHYQERMTDARMERTSDRPIPSGKVSSTFTVIFSLCMLIAGSVILIHNFPPLVLSLGLFNFFWYNAVYTPLKKVTAFAVVPGSLTGGIPPLIGWVAAGGYWLDPDIIIIVLFFITGQIPHFWLLLLKYGRQYEEAGLPSITAIFTTDQIKRISNTWILATLAASAILLLRGLISHPAAVAAWFAGSLLLIGSLIYHGLMQKNDSDYKLPFAALNFFYLLIMLLLATDSLTI